MLPPSIGSLLASLVEAVCANCVHALTHPPHAGTERRLNAVPGPLGGVSATTHSAAIVPSNGTGQGPNAVYGKTPRTAKQNKTEPDDADNIGAHTLISFAARGIQTKPKLPSRRRRRLKLPSRRRGGPGGLYGPALYRSHRKHQLLTHQPDLTLPEYIRHIMSPEFKGKNARNDKHKSVRSLLPKSVQSRLQGEANGAKAINAVFLDEWKNLTPYERDQYNACAKQITQRTLAAKQQALSDKSTANKIDGEPMETTRED